MSNATLPTVLLKGSTLVPGSVEVHVQRGLPEFRIIGLPDKSMREAQTRVRTALIASGFKFPLGRVTVNIGPADLPKRGTHLDLSIALGILMATKALPKEAVLAIGELSLEGDIRTVVWSDAVTDYAKNRGIPWLLASSPTQGGKGAYAKNVREAAQTITAHTWRDQPKSTVSTQSRLSAYAIDSIQGNAIAKRALCVALAGSHTLLLSGPPGAGKSILAYAAAELLPPPTQEDMSRRTLQIGEATTPELIRVPQTTTVSQVLGTDSKPGLLAYARSGILFLDELPHFRRETLDALRQPLEEAASAHITVIAARNYCPCGRAGVPGEVCMCSPAHIARYERLLSAPLLDRFALAVPMDYSSAGTDQVGVHYAHAISRVRSATNRLRIEEDASSLIEQATSRNFLSYRAQAHVRALAETIARLDEKNSIGTDQVQEALQYRVRRV